MPKLIERVKGKTWIRNDEKVVEPIRLEELVHMGSELIWFNAPQNLADERARILAIQLAKEYKCDYVLLGSNTLQLNRSQFDFSNYVYIATFYNEKENNKHLKIN
ncbi:MAG: hypothetical protein ABH824_06725 [Nanoarchaeota archaeon]|nr:hypothetical protein [Nanoarchaeota archaeon]MBU1631711.1 hypothetical protein [Nanoarchaeota archaeon]MBU1876227.1 hypothetical protein [Nanoarchaeota archaeon]